MDIARHWHRVVERVDSPALGPIDLECWGWSAHDAAEAERTALRRHAELARRLVAEGRFPEAYSYDARPAREEIVREIDLAPGATSLVEAGPSAALLTRNGYGALVLNAAQLLFADVDVAPDAPGLLGRLLGRRDPVEAALERIRGALERSRGRYRIHRTAGGLRVIRLDQAQRPDERATLALLESLESDPRYVQLCRVQRCFRARLSPKPWRVGLDRPPGRHPRESDALHEAFESWLSEYDAASRGHSVCRHLEDIGGGRPAPGLEGLVTLHDELTGADRGLPLA